jgi:hypothetical protein
MKQTGFPFHSLTALAFAVTLAATSGCFLVAIGAAGAAGAGTVAYIRGELDATLGNQYDLVIKATDGSIGQLQFAKVRETKDAFSSEIIARTAEDKKIDITITKVADNLTKVAIRIGVFGDEEKSRAILDKIKGNL